MKFCPECGEKRYKEGKFCTECGFNFLNASEPDVAKPEAVTKEFNLIEVIQGNFPKYKPPIPEEIENNPKFIDLAEKVKELILEDNYSHSYFFGHIAAAKNDPNGKELVMYYKPRTSTAKSSLILIRLLVEYALEVKLEDVFINKYFHENFLSTLHLEGQRGTPLTDDFIYETFTRMDRSVEIYEDDPDGKRERDTIYTVMHYIQNKCSDDKKQIAEFTLSYIFREIDPVTRQFKTYTTKPTTNTKNEIINVIETALDYSSPKGMIKGILNAFKDK